jgi:rhodanese-related sulfurtransferase
MVKEIYNKKYILYLVIIFFIIAFIYFSYQYAVSSKYRVSSEHAKKMIMDKKIDLVLDVRTDVERNTLGYYPGSKHIQSADLEKRMTNEYPNKDIRIISYCNTGHRARMATDKLHELGYRNAMYISSTYTSLM